MRIFTLLFFDKETKYTCSDSVMDANEAPYLFNIEPHFPFEHTTLNIAFRVTNTICLAQY